MRLLSHSDALLLTELQVAVEHAGRPSGWSSIIGIVTAIVGNILISFALNTQRYAHVRLEEEYNEKRGDSPAGKRQANGHQGYGTTEQERVANERSKANATAPGPGGSSDEHDTPSSPDHMGDSFESDDTIRPGEKDDEDQGRKSYLKSKIWWAGIIMMTIGETGNFLAYGFAPASIVSPLGVVALISNCLIAPLVLKEPFRQRDFWGVVIAILGAVTVVFSANQNEAKLDPDVLWNHYIKRWEFLVYVIVTIIAIIALTIASPKYGKRTIAVDLGLVGLYGGYTAVSTKGVAALLSASLYKAFTFPIFYVLVLVLISSAIMQIRYLNKALQNFNSTQVIPTQFVCFTLSVIIGSAVLYREFESETADHAIKFVAGCLLTFFGVYLITSKHAKNEDGEKEDYDEEEEEEDEAIHLIDEEGQEATERTPLRLDTNHKLQHPHADRFLTPGQPVMDTPFPVTPPRSPTHSNVPSIAVTPATQTPQRNPWDSDAMLPPPRTPLARNASDMEATPFFTPSTSRRLMQRTDSSPADPETPTRPQRGPSPPKLDSAAVAAAAQNGFLRRSTRDSIQRLIPGPLLAPLASSSLSGIVADSLRRGEGSPISVRQRLRRSRTARQFNDRRRSVQPGDEETGMLSRQMTHDGVQARSTTIATQSAEDVTDVINGGGSTEQKKSRLRSMSETFGSLMRRDSNRGKRREDGGRGSES